MMCRLLLYCLLFMSSTSCYALSSDNPCVLVRAAPDYSLVLSLIEKTNITIHMMPKRASGCACCQHGAPHTHMTVSEARNNHQRCVMPKLKRWTNLTQAVRMVKKWTHLLMRAFPENKDVLLANQVKLTAILTQLKTKWQNVSEEEPSADDIHVALTTSGYVEALEKWFETSQKVVTHADMGRSIHTGSQARS